MQTLRQRVHGLLDSPAPANRAGRAVQLGLLVLIILNVAAVMVDSVAGLAGAWAGPLHLFEAVSVGLFTLEYFLRAWIAPERKTFSRPFTGRLRYLLSPLALLDLVAILPAYLPMLFAFDLRFLRALRMLRLLRLSKIGRYSKSVQIMRSVLADRKNELLAAGSLLVMVIIMAAGLMFTVEHEAQPESFSSIPAAMWWAMATLSTMGIDVRPVTALGKVLASLIAVSGILLFALPAGIIGSGFVEKHMAARKNRACPHCGKNLDDPPTPAHSKPESSNASRMAGSTHAGV